jgi:hypothetical protein
VVAVALLSPTKASFAALVVAVSVMMVPLAVPTVTLYVTVKIPVEPAATLGLVQLTPTQVHPAGATIETNVVLAGVASVKVAVVAAADPVLVTTCV